MIGFGLWRRTALVCGYSFRLIFPGNLKSSSYAYDLADIELNGNNAMSQLICCDYWTFSIFRYRLSGIRIESISIFHISSSWYAVQSGSVYQVSP